MTTRPIHAWDYDCEDEDDVAISPPTVMRRKVRARRVIFGAEGDEQQLLVSCSLRGVTELADCSACPRLKSYSLKPSGNDSFVTCTNTTELHALPIPLNATARGRAMRTPLTDLMADPVCVRSCVPLVRLARFFTETGLSGLPVVDAQGRGTGFVTKTNVVDAIGKGETPATVADVMTREMDSVRATATLLAAIDLMAMTKRRRLPVVSDVGAVVGMISTTDVTAWLSRLDAGGGTSKVCPAAL